MPYARRIEDVHTKIRMPAGTYWVGDPCYSVPDNRWMKWLREADYENERRFLLAHLEKNGEEYPVLGIGTAHGDGYYFDDLGMSYPVDAGMIGLVPVEVAIKAPNGAHKITFPKPFDCSYEEEEGTIILGHISIKTDEKGYWS